MFGIISFLFWLWVLSKLIGFLSKFIKNKSNSEQNSNYRNYTNYNQKTSFNINDAVFLIKLLAKVARANGVVREEEARYVSQMLDLIAGELGTDAYRQRLKFYFNDAKDNNESPRNIAFVYARSRNLTHQYKIDILSYLFELGAIDGNLDEKESEIIYQVCKGFGFYEDQISQIFAEFKRKYEFKHRRTYSDFSYSGQSRQKESGYYRQNQQNSRAQTMDYARACEILGVSQSDDFEMIKKSYRKLALKYHPDRGGSEEKMKEINDAYEIIKDRKGK